MRNVSKQFREQLQSKDRHLLYWADITLLDKTVIKLNNDKLMQSDGFKIDDATSGTSSFDVGSIIINKLSLKLDNMDDVYSTYDFDGASVVAYVGMKLPDGTIEKIRIGTYTVDEPKAVETTIVLECLDNIRLLDKAYSKSTLKYPATLLQIVKDACKNCGLILNTKNFEHSGYVVENRPDDEATTFREVMMWVAQIACKYVRCDEYGRVFLSWYDERDYLDEFVLADEVENKIHADAGEEIIIFAPPAVDPEKMDGGRFDKDLPYSTGDSVDGGLFNPWENKTTYDAGVFETMKTYHHIWSLFSLNVGTDEIQITGVSVSLENESGEGSKYLYGETGYVISIEKNELIQSEAQANSVAVMVGEKLVGMVFRTFDASHLSDPTIEAGDSAYVTDRKQNSYKTYVTNTIFTAGGAQKSSCGAETPARRQSDRFTQATKAIVEAKKNTAKQISTYDESVQMLTNLMTQSFGVYKTAEQLEDGSTIYYMHNESTLEESDTIWKMTADAFAVSTDGGKTWNAGMDSQGNAVVNVLSAIGIRFDWARGGILTLGGENNVSGVMKILDGQGKEVGVFDKDGAFVTGTFRSYWLTNIGDLFCTLSASGIEFKNNSEVKGMITIKKGINQNSRGITLSTMGFVSIDDMKSNTVAYAYDNSDREQKHTWWGSEAHNGDIFVKGMQGKSGTAQFSDGSYLQFTNGILTGGKTASGTTF